MTFARLNTIGIIGGIVSAIIGGSLGRAYAGETYQQQIVREAGYWETTMSMATWEQDVDMFTKAGATVKNDCTDRTCVQTMQLFAKKSDLAIGEMRLQRYADGRRFFCFVDRQQTVMACKNYDTGQTFSYSPSADGARWLVNNN